MRPPSSTSAIALLFVAACTEPRMIDERDAGTLMVGENTQSLPFGFGLFFPEAEMRNEENMGRANFIAGIGDPGSTLQLAALQAYSDRIGLLDAFATQVVRAVVAASAESLGLARDL
jgi:hypothetical protein